MKHEFIEKLRQFHWELYQKAVQESDSSVFLSNKEVLSYSESFTADLPDKVERLGESEFFENISSVDYLLYGDFHTLKQSQRGLLRMLRSLIPKKKIKLAFEMFASSDNRLIADFIQQRIEEEEFLAKTQYFLKWGFPWKNYSPLLQFAIENNFEVVGINLIEGTRKVSLAERDQHAAEELVKLAPQKDELVVCIIGEYHLASEHLPRKIFDLVGSESRVCRVVNNIDRFYFSLEAYGSTRDALYSRLNDGFYCVTNTPPWVKWQSLTNWEEMRRSLCEPDYDFEIYNDYGIDLDFEFSKVLNHLIGFLGLPKVEADCYLISSEDCGLVRTLFSDQGMERREIEGAFAHLDEFGFYFIPTCETLVLKNLSINSLTQAAGLYLYSRMKETSDDRDTVFGMAAATVASKLLNPQRKLPSLVEEKLKLEALAGKRLIGEARRTRDFARAVVSFFSDPSKLRASQKCFLGEIGVVLGAEIFRKVMNGELDPKNLSQIFDNRSYLTHFNSPVAARESA